MPRDPDGDAFSMLQNSHNRLRERLADLQDAITARDRDGIADVLRFFDRAVSRHERDEEASLFPRLEHVDALRPLIADLTAQHGTQASLVEALRTRFENGEDTTLAELASQLVASYDGHIDREENELFPAARKEITHEAQHEMLREMDQRRGR